MLLHTCRKVQNYMFAVSSEWNGCSDTSAGQRFLPHNRTHKVGEFRVSGGVHDRTLHIPVRTGGIFYFPWHRHHMDRRNRRLNSVSSERHWQSGVNGIAKVQKRSCPQWNSNPSRQCLSQDLDFFKKRSY